ncbi:uncharacterized protein LOC119838830 [Zerene cesonia]|uniref:uncharacterized protein LOC119838830 n=1 Tax=Zerene cesonia TaxID=33412 RepID=UPI0018E54B82|nr:uncharacterized protein LOC119838830 [Zerene cesonia]
MYRVIAFAVLLTVVNCHWCHGGPGPCWHHPPHRFHHHHHGHPWHHRHGPDFKFDMIADKVIESDEAYQEYCKTHSNIAQEMFGPDGYTLKYKLPGFDERSMSVQIKHRVVFVKAAKSTEVFQDVKVLSDILKMDDAKWYHEDDFLVVTVPYKIAIGVETTGPCGENINREVQNVLQDSPPVDIGNLYRNGVNGLPALNFSPNNKVVK